MIDNTLKTLHERVHGSLAGLAIGDAMGMPTEFMTPAQIGQSYGWVDRLVNPHENHFHHGLPAGRITDDTGQALALCRAYLGQGGLTPQTMARELLAWADQEPYLHQLVGPNTARALGRLRRGADPRLSGREGSTNGAAMRAPVVGMVHPGKPEACLPDVLSMCLPTHGTSPAISGAAAVACAVAEALRNGASLESILEAARQGADAGYTAGNREGTWKWSTPLSGRIQLAVQLVNQSNGTEQALRALYDFVGVDMLVAESVASAFGVVLLAGGDPYRAICYGANIGGDTDTIAAIAGSVCGAWQGIHAIPIDLLSRVEELNQLDLASTASRLAGLFVQEGAG